MLTAAALLLAAALPPPPACPVERVDYRLHGAPDFRAGFARLPHPTLYSDLVFFLTTPERTFWFTFTQSQGYSLTYLLPSASPEHFYDDEPPRPRREDEAELPSPQFLAFAADRTPLEPADFDATPPATILVPTLGRDLWYDAVGLANRDARAEQEMMPTATFEAVGCAERPH